MLIWMLISLLGGVFVLSELPWGDPNGLHGKGLPLPTTIFEQNADTGSVVPASSLTPYFGNAVLVWLLGIGCWLILRHVGRGRAHRGYRGS